MHDLCIVALAAAGVVGLRGSLDGEHEGDVAVLLHPLTHLLVDQGGVGVQGKEAVPVLLRQLEDVVHANRRLTAGHHVQVDTQLLALGDDLVHVLIGEVGLVAVGAGPAAHAVHVAGHGGIEEDQPRDVAVVLLTVLADLLGAAKERLIAEGHDEVLGIAGIGVIDDAVDVFDPLAVVVADALADLVKCRLVLVVSDELLRQVDDLDIGIHSVLIALPLDVLEQAVDRHRHCLTLCSVLHVFDCVCH